MFCQNCGNKVEGNQTFCSRCGARMNNYNQPPYTQYYRSVQTPDDKNADNALIFGLISLLIFCPISIIFSILAINYSNKCNIKSDKASAGKVLGIISLVIYCIILFFILLLILIPLIAYSVQDSNTSYKQNNYESNYHNIAVYDRV